MTNGATLSQKPILFMISRLRVIRRFFADAPVARPQTVRGSTTSGVPNIGIIAIAPPRGGTLVGRIRYHQGRHADDQEDRHPGRDPEEEGSRDRLLACLSTHPALELWNTTRVGRSSRRIPRILRCVRLCGAHLRERCSRSRHSPPSDRSGGLVRHKHTPSLGVR